MYLFSLQLTESFVIKFLWEAFEGFKSELESAKLEA